MFRLNVNDDLRRMSMQTFQIEVTQEDIDKGLKGNCSACPIALAVNRTIPGANSTVSDMFNHVYCPGVSRKNADTPDDAAWFISDFDDGKPVEPFSFTLTLE